MGKDREKFLKRRAINSEVKCREKLEKRQYFDRNNLPSAANDAANIKIGILSSVPLPNKNT